MHDRVCPPRRMRFSFESRCRIVSLIVEGVSPQAAAAACGASRATGYRLWRRYREGGWAALADRPSDAQAPAAAAARARPSRRSSLARELRGGPAVIAAGRSASRLDGRQGAAPRRLLAAAACRAATRASATSASGRASSCTSTSRSSAASGRSASASAATASTAPATPAGSTCTSRSTTTPGSPTASCSRASASTTASPSSRRAVAWYARAGDRDRARALRQRARPTTPTLWRDTCAELEIGRRYTRPYSPVDQRQGRSADQDAAARMGLPLRLPHQRTPRPRTPRLPPLVQPTTTARLARRPTADQPRLTRLWSVHLAADGSRPTAAGLRTRRSILRRRGVRVQAARSRRGPHRGGDRALARRRG